MWYEDDWVSISASASYQLTQYELTKAERDRLKEREKRPFGFTLPEDDDES